MTSKRAARKHTHACVFLLTAIKLHPTPVALNVNFSTQLCGTAVAVLLLVHLTGKKRKPTRSFLFAQSAAKRRRFKIMWRSDGLLIPTEAAAAARLLCKKQAGGGEKHSLNAQ